MAKIVVGVSGNTMDLESVKRVLMIASVLGMPDSTDVVTNVTYFGLSAGEAELDWLGLEQVNSGLLMESMK